MVSRTFHGVPMRTGPFVHKSNALIHGYVTEPFLLQFRIRDQAVGDHRRSGLYPSLTDNHQCRCCAILHGHQESSPRFPLDGTEHPVNLRRPPVVVLPTKTFVYLNRRIWPNNGLERSFHAIQYVLSTELRSVSDGRFGARTPRTSRVPVPGVAGHTSRKSPQKGRGCS